MDVILQVAKGQCITGHHRPVLEWPFLLTRAPWPSLTNGDMREQRTSEISSVLLRILTLISGIF